MTPFAKKTCLAAFFFLMLGVARLSAQVLASEPFEVDGVLKGLADGTGFSGAWSVSGSSTISWTVSGGVASVSGDNGTTTASRTFSSAITSADTSSFYFSFTADVTSLGSAVLSGSHSLTDALSFVSGSTTVFSTQIFISNAGYRVREAYGTNGGTTAYVNANSTTAGVTYTVVGKFTFDTGTGTASLTIWINPTSSASTSVTYTWTSSVSSITGITLARSDSYDVGTGTTTTFGNILVGDTWSDVTASAIPEPAAYAVLCGLAAMGLAVAKRWRSR